MSLLASRLIEIHDALQHLQLPHAFGGAIALAYCTEEPRGTRDLDLNVFVGTERAREALDALPAAVQRESSDVQAAERDGQVRVWWEDTPIDVFLDVHDFHRAVRHGVRWVPFEDRTVPVVGCEALAVFKALLARTKDWADIEAMVDNDSLDIADVAASLEGLVGSGHPSIRRLLQFGD